MDQKQKPDEITGLKDKITQRHKDLKVYATTLDSMNVTRNTKDLAIAKTFQIIKEFSEQTKTLLNSSKVTIPEGFWESVNSGTISTKKSTEAVRHFVSTIAHAFIDALDDTYIAMFNGNFDKTDLGILNQSEKTLAQEVDQAIIDYGIVDEYIVSHTQNTEA